MKKFNEDLRVAVITTKYVIKEGQPILYVFHHEDDGMWEFVGDKGKNDDDYLVVALENVIKHDDSVLELVDLPLGHKAYRRDQNSAWIIEPM